MQMTGHKTRSVFHRYHIVSQGDLFDAAKRLDSFTGIVSGIVSIRSRLKLVSDSMIQKNGRPGGNRTPDLRFRKAIDFLKASAHC